MVASKLQGTYGIQFLSGSYIMEGEGLTEGHDSELFFYPKPGHPVSTSYFQCFLKNICVENMKPNVGSLNY